MRGKSRLLHAYTMVIISWLSLPILVMILFGFNDTKGRFNFSWQGFTLNWYRHLFAIDGLTSALTWAAASAPCAALIRAASALRAAVNSASGA